MFYICAYIRKRDGKWVVLSEKGKVLGTYPTKQQALKRLRQIEYFKNKKASDFPEIYTDWFNPGSSAITAPELTEPEQRTKWVEGWGKKHKRDEEPVPDYDVQENIQLDISHPIKYAWIRTGEDQLTVAKKIGKLLSDAGYEAFFVGGAVRDLILQRKPADYDLVTSAPLSEIVRILEANGFQVNAIPQHHVAIVYDPVTKIKTDVAEYRKDENLTGRQTEAHSVRAQTLEEDLERRDFTIGAIAQNVVTGEFVDPFGGIDDIKNRVLRTVGDPYQRFSEDLLRILRGLRFAATFDLTIEPKTKAAMRELGKNIPKFVPPERIMGELMKVANNAVLSKFIKLADEVGILEYIYFGELLPLKGLEHGIYHQEDPFTHTLMVLENLEKMEGVSKETLLAGLFHDIGKALAYKKDPITGKVTFYGHEDISAELAQKILSKLRFDNGTINKVVQLIKNHMKLHSQEISDKTLRKLYREFAGELEPLLQLTYADSHGRIGPKLYDNVESLKERIKTLHDSPQQMEPLISGHDIMALLNISSGPVIKKIKDEILEKQLEGSLKTKEDAQKYIVENAERLKNLI